MHIAEFTWHETDPTRPALDVLVRLCGLDHEYDARELAPYLLQQHEPGVWSGSVKVPADLRTSYQFCPVRDFRVPPSGLDDDGWAKVMAAGVADASNPRTIGPCTYGNQEIASILELPLAVPQPWCEPRPGVPRGEVVTFQTGLTWPATVYVYTPPGFAELTGPLPVAVLFDAQTWTRADVTATFDNLIADAVVPPFVVAMLGYPYGPVRVNGLTQPSVHLPYLLDELMPWLESDFRVTSDPARTVVIGQSLGGLAAVHAALRADRFGVAVSQSGSFWWPGDGDGQLSGAGVIAAVAAARPKTRFWLEAGALETGLVPGNRELHRALAARGLDVSYREYQGGHDFACWRGGLGDSLASCLGN